MPRVFDCFTFFNELDVLDIRLAELDPLVDFFVIVEAPWTFTARSKPLHFAENRSRYERYAPKIIHVVVDDLPVEAPSHWIRETHQRDAIMRGLSRARPDDRIIISDCDEIPKPRLLRHALTFRNLSHRIVAFWCENYFYRFNLRNNAHDHRLGPRLLTMSSLTSPQAIRELPLRFSKRPHLKWLSEPMAFLRTSRRMGRLIWPTILWNGAWHFSYLGDRVAVNHKIASFSHAGEIDLLSESAFRSHFSSLERRPLSEMPEAVRSGRFTHLLA
ncbi:MAG: hypothetical protein IT536_00860 [Hyphomicrobiales bacterium]|nr:hypothetical protein [Hyphomicrobiales bacterium]